MTNEQKKLQQLASYLPYNLMCLVDEKHKAQLDAVYSNATCCFHNLVESDQGFLSVKPMLKPLIDADSYIRTQFYLYHQNKPCARDVIDLFDVDFIHTNELVSELDVLDLPFKSVQWLLKNHYDVYGLLDKGEAVQLT